MAAVLAAAGVLTVAFWAARGMVSVLYASLAHDLVRQPGGWQAGGQAAEQAVALAPWHADAYAHLAEVHWVNGNLPAAALTVQQRLRWAPASERAWRQRATLYRRAGRYDNSLLMAYRAALQRAPYSTALNFLIAVDALDGWQAGDEALRALWLESTRRAYRHNSKWLLIEVARRGREKTFCSYASGQIHGTTAWCEQLPRYRAACAAKDLSADQITWCVNLGLRSEAVPHGR